MIDIFIVTVLTLAWLMIFRTSIINGIAHLINAPREAMLRRMVDETGRLTREDRCSLLEIIEKEKRIVQLHDMKQAEDYQEIMPYDASGITELRQQIGENRPFGYLDKFGRVFHYPEPEPPYELAIADEWISPISEDTPNIALDAKIGVDI
jgi:hypothetical protein